MSAYLRGVLVLGLLCSMARADLPGYVSKADPSYAWSKLQDGKTDDGVQFTELVMTSQTWRGITWKHKLAIVRPEKSVKTAQALLVIGGGSWKDGDEQVATKPDSRDLKLAASIAKASRTTVAFLKHVPFQPMFGDLHEDQIISHTFREYLQSGEEDWPLLLPMTKAAVRAMDTIQAYAKQEWKEEIADFVVCGGSKRGWTTYLTGAIDPRVKGIAPMVFDTLRLGEQMKHQLATWGQFSEQIEDYTRIGLQEQLDTPGGKKLVSLVDPYAYRAKLTMPKLLIFGTNDRYWPLDALNLYWDDLPGEKYILYVPNAGHGINDMVRVVSSVSALGLKVAGKLEFPRLTWKYTEADGGLKLNVQSSVKPVKAVAWTASVPTRDFRPAKWSDQELAASGDGYSYQLEPPAEGFSAVLGEVYYEINGRPLYLSTNVRIIGKKQ